MTNPDPSQTVVALLKEEVQVAVQVANLRDQLDAAQERRKVLRSALEGARLGQALAAEVAAASAE